MCINWLGNVRMGVPKWSHEHVSYGKTFILTVPELTPNSFSAINILKHARQMYMNVLLPCYGQLSMTVFSLVTVCHSTQILRALTKPYNS